MSRKTKEEWWGIKKNPVWNAPVVPDNKRVCATSLSKEELETAQPLGLRMGVPRMKPLGIWYAFGNDWLDMVQDIFPLRSNTYENVFIIEVGGNILKLETLQDHIDFTEKYSQYPNNSSAINWPLVVKDYDGIEAKGGTLRSQTTPSDSKIAWLYGWDVDSGCTWNPQIKVTDTLFSKDDPNWEEVMPRTESNFYDDINATISEYQAGLKKSWKDIIKAPVYPAQDVKVPNQHDFEWLSKFPVGTQNIKFVSNDNNARAVVEFRHANKTSSILPNFHHFALTSFVVSEFVRGGTGQKYLEELIDELHENQNDILTKLLQNDIPEWKEGETITRPMDFVQYPNTKKEYINGLQEAIEEDRWLDIFVVDVKPEAKNFWDRMVRYNLVREE